MEVFIAYKERGQNTHFVDNHHDRQQKRTTLFLLKMGDLSYPSPFWEFHPDFTILWAVLIGPGSQN